jgi:hypothetical protein
LLLQLSRKKKRKKRTVLKKEAKKRRFPKKRGKRKKRGGMGCQISAIETLTEYLISLTFFPIWYKICSKSFC